MSKLSQARKGIQFSINESPETIIIYRKPLTDNGFDGLIENPFGTETAHTIKCRLSHEKKFPGNLDSSSAGFTQNLARFILVNYQTIIYENDIFESALSEKSFKIGPVDPLYKFGGVIGYQASLIEAAPAESES